MIRLDDFNRNTLQWTVLLTVALGVSLCVGCRNTGRQPIAAAPAPPFPVAQPMADMSPPILLGTDATIGTSFPDHVQAFRPITPDPQPMAAAPEPSAPPRQKVIDDLNDQVTELQKKLAEQDRKLAEKEEALERALLPVPVSEAPKATAAIPLPPPKTPPVLPTISVADVHTAVDGESVRIRIPDAVLFQPGTIRLTPDGEDALRTISAELRTKYPKETLEIEGHTDSLQTDPTNATHKHEVAALKSQVVVQYFLQTLQWKPEAIAVSGYGSSRPVADNGTPEGRAQNNRIEIVVK